MAFALIVLAIGSVVAGYAGLSNRFEMYLEPSFAVRTAEAATDSGLEWTLMGVSSLVAILGIGIAAYFFWKNRGAADTMADRFSGIHRVLEHKYYVDEIYGAAIVQPIRIASEDALWKGVDVNVIDWTVNAVGRVVSASSDTLRRLQTGSVRAYAVSIFAGVVMILGYYLWR